MHYTHPTLKDPVKVKVLLFFSFHRRTDQRQYAPDHSIQRNLLKCLDSALQMSDYIIKYTFVSIIFNEFFFIQYIIPAQFLVSLTPLHHRVADWHLKPMYCQCVVNTGGFSYQCLRPVEAIHWDKCPYHRRWGILSFLWDVAFCNLQLWSKK